MIYFFIGLGILLLGLVTLIIIKIKGLKEIEKKLNITEEKISEILKTKKDNLDKISRDMDDKKLINKLKEDNDNIFKFEQNLYDVKFEIKKIINNNEYTPSKELEKLLDDIDLEERLEGLKDYYNSNSIKYNELLYKKPFNYIYKLFKLDAKNTFKIQVSEELDRLKSIGLIFFDIRKLFVLENGLLPKKPYLAENGLGCVDSITKCLGLVISTFLLLA